MNYFVEGLQGSGKSTLVEKLSKKYPSSRVFREGDYSPVELAWCARVTKEKYAEILEKYSEIRTIIEEKSHAEGDNIIICYTKVITDVPGFHKDLEQYEIYNGRYSYDDFKKIVFERFKAWNGDNMIFECSLFQNIVEDMILYRNASDREIMEFYRELAELIKDKPFHIYYLKTDDIADNIGVIRKERSDENGNEMWFPLMMKFFDESPYAKSNNVSGEEELYRHFSLRQDLELRICRELFPDKVTVLDSKAYLPEDLELQNDADKEEVRFAAGAIDGIRLYHMGFDPLEEDDHKRLEELLMLAGKGDAEEAKQGFAEFCKKHRAITIIDELQECIVENKENLAPKVMFDFAVNLFRYSAETECVKIGLIILELFNTKDNEEIKNSIREAGASDEFTFFALLNMRRWPTAEEEILECAKHVRGWGRIHCVDYIEPEDNETKEWLLFNGTDNDVMPVYSAWNVFIKSDVPALLRRGNLKYEEMHAILKITEALMDEGPVSGISNFDNPETFLGDVLYRTEEGYSFTEEDLKIIQDIHDYMEADHEREEDL